MLWTTTYRGCISTVWTLLLLSQPTGGTKFVLRDLATGETRVRRACEPASPNVTVSSIIANICNQTVVNEFNQCPEQMAVSIQKSTANTCEQYSLLYTDCMLANNNNSLTCSDSHFGYQDCTVYTMQAYDYCACYFTLPKSIAECANQQLQPQPQAQNTTTLRATNTSLAAIPTSSENPASAVTADQEPTPPHPIPSEDITSATDQGPLTTSDPQQSTAPSNDPDPNLQPKPQPPAQNTTTPLALTTTPTSSDVPASAVTADGEPPPPYPIMIPSEDGIPATDDQGRNTTSDPQTSPSSSPQKNPDSIDDNTEPSTGAQQLPTTTTTTVTVIATDTTTTTIYTTTMITTAAATITTTTTTITTSPSMVTATVYACSSSDATVPAPAVGSSIPSAEPAGRSGSGACVGCRRGRRSKMF